VNNKSGKKENIQVNEKGLFVIFLEINAEFLHTTKTLNILIVNSLQVK